MQAYGERNIDMLLVHLARAHVAAGGIHDLKVLSDVDEARVDEESKAFVVKGIVNGNGGEAQIVHRAIAGVAVNASIPGVGSGNAGEQAEGNGLILCKKCAKRGRQAKNKEVKSSHWRCLRDGAIEVTKLHIYVEVPYPGRGCRTGR